MYSACGPFTKNKEWIQKLKKKEGSRYIYQNELDKLVLSMIWLSEIWKTYLAKQLQIKYHVIKHLILLIIQEYDGYQDGLTSVVYKFLDKMSSGSAITLARSENLNTRTERDKSAIENKIVSNQHLAEELLKPIIKKFEQRNL